MKVYGDIEAVNLSTGERWQRVTGNGESRLLRVCLDGGGNAMYKVIYGNAVRELTQAEVDEISREYQHGDRGSHQKTSCCIYAAIPTRSPRLGCQCSDCQRSRQMIKELENALPQRT